MKNFVRYLLSEEKKHRFLYRIVSHEESWYLNNNMKQRKRFLIPKKQVTQKSEIRYSFAKTDVLIVEQGTIYLLRISRTEPNGQHATLCSKLRMIQNSYSRAKT